jgi:hypothetical protein
MNEHKSADRISDEAWSRRFIDEGKLRGFNEEEAQALLRTVSIEEWRADFDNDPEGAIREELTYWDDDGDE